MKLAVMLIAVFLISFAVSLEADLSCPEKVNLNQEFVCQISLSEGSGLYDLKFEIKEGTKTITDVWTGESWKSGYYYLPEFIESGEEKEIRVKIESGGEWDGKIKFRQGGTTESFDFSIVVEEEIEEKVFEESLSTNPVEPEGEKGRKIMKEPVIEVYEKKESETITLNKVEEVSESENVIKESKYSATEYTFITISLIVLILLFFGIRDKF